MEPVEPLLTGNVNWDLARKFRESRKLMYEGSNLESMNNIDGAQQLYLAAYHANHQDLKALKALFMLLRKNNRLHMLPPELQFLAKPPSPAPSR
jgi:hypothetical protein